MILNEAPKINRKTWKPLNLTWGEFLDRVRTPLRTAETVAEYQAMNKDQKASAKDCGAYVAGELRNGRRKGENVVNRCMVTLDADYSRPGQWDTVTALFDDVTMCAYSTHSHTAEKPRLRWIIPTDRPMTPEEYPAVARIVATWLGIDTVDATCFKLTQAMYWPSCPVDGVFEFHEQEGRTLRVDEVLAEYGPGDEWKNPNLWPTSSRESSAPISTGTKAADPEVKRGIVGLFCRAYDVPAAIDEFLPDVYVEAGVGRYTFTGGTTAGGARVYDRGMFLYSSHDSDPARGHSRNAFDLVRIHKFGYLDEGCDADCPPTSLPSYQAMCEFAGSLEPVKELEDEERKAEAEAAFGDLTEAEVEKAPDVFTDFGFYSVPDLTEAERRPPEFIIAGMLPVGMTFLSGAPKTRKSFLALQMAIAVASGRPFWGRDVKQCDVAYLDLEGSKSRIATRTAGMEDTMPHNVYVTNRIPARLAGGDLVKKLRLLHRQKPTIRFVIVDTFSRARGNVKANGSNAYDADVSLLEPIQRMALEENIAILFVHHDKKGAGLMSDSFERLSGTMGISGSADCVINLITDGKRFDGKAKLECTPRDAKGFTLGISFNDLLTEWLPDEKPTLDHDPLCAWILNNTPSRGCEGRFWKYEDVFRAAYGTVAENPGRCILDALAPYQDELYTGHRICIQTSVKSNGTRGIRIINAA